jgi:hypothetical protein
MRVFRKRGVEAAPMAVPDIIDSAEYWPARFSDCWLMTAESAKIAYYELRGWI